MLYEKKRTFAREPIALNSAAIAVGVPAYAGQALSAVAATAGTIDYEEANQHFPDENTIEVIGWEDATSATSAATVAVVLQSSADASAWKDEVAFTLGVSEIKRNQLIRRFTIPSQTRRHMRLKLTAGTEVFTAGKMLALVRPL